MVVGIQLSPTFLPSLRNSCRAPPNWLLFSLCARITHLPAWRLPALHLQTPCISEPAPTFIPAIHHHPFVLCLNQLLNHSPHPHSPVPLLQHILLGPHYLCACICVWIWLSKKFWQVWVYIIDGILSKTQSGTHTGLFQVYGRGKSGTKNMMLKWMI